MSTGSVKFGVICSLFTWMQRSKSTAKKRSKFRKFLDAFCKSGDSDCFSAVRLILPSLDRDRGTYGLKESVLATCLIDALGVSRESDDALRLVNWRKGGARTGPNVGNFSLVAAEVLQRRQTLASGGLTIKDVNDSLDRLAACENRAEKTLVLSDLIKKTNAQEMKWIVMIILKDLKLGVSEKSIFHEFHPDAEDLFNVTCDLKLVCEKLRDRSQRHKRQDIEVGKAVRPQLATRVSNAASAWKKLHGKEVIAECKFDGDRIQIHKNGAEIHFFSRTFLDHAEYGPGMSNVIMQSILVDRCILDGEMLVWDTSCNRFAEFGSNQEIAKAAKEGFDSDRQLCYVAFDILYVGDTSVIHQSLKERHELLQKVVKPLKGRMEILVPNGGLNANRTSGEPCWSIVARSLEEVERFFKDTIENKDEGIVLKDLGSKWDPGDRSGKWLKLKPDYIHPGSDLDVLIIGGYYGSGRRGGQVAQFLVGLAEQSAPDTYPKRFMSFCRVGTGLSDDELDTLTSKLKPYFRKNEYPKKTPSFYEVTNNSKERPDVWIDSPEKSIILSITSDIRTIKSEVFAAPYSLRFPRVDRVRYDKPWHECLDVQSFVDLVHSSNGNIHRGADYNDAEDNKPKRIKSSRKGKQKNSVVPSHFMQTDISGVKKATLIFANMLFYFINVPTSHSLDSLHKMVAENGGSFSMNLNESVTHCIAAEQKGIKYQAAKLRGDIIHYSWVLDCCSQKRILHLHPKYFLFLADSSKKKLEEEIDVFSDSYFWDLDLKDIKQLFSNMQRTINISQDPKSVDCYMKKYYPGDKWSHFRNCSIYFYMVHSINVDSNILLDLALRKLRVEVSMYGGKICSKLFCASHLVILSVPGSDIDVDAIFASFPKSERRFLLSTKLHIVGHQWLDDSLGNDQKLQEEEYSLKPSFVERSGVLLSSEVLDPHDTAEETGNQDIPSSSPKRSGTQKRRRPAPTRMNRGKTRPRPRNKLAKIDDKNDSENSASSSEALHKEDIGLDVQSREAPRIQESTKEGETLDIDFSDGKEALECLDEKKESSQKLEVMVDPLQAMLFDMIPTLGEKKADEPSKSVTLSEEPESGSSAEPVKKKKKVSYKDVAGELLKDW
ncbi:hypothetical protein Syun_024812 [Stephania yunnanensis]|uniref:DNA ligase n=1 Tax=Stephania yunnanensis TaxID=152371 RepID=A0AAP0HUC2_9MAGN